MKPDLMEILVCPLCKKRLELSMKEQTGHAIISGFLYCSKCKRKYPVKDEIPDLLPVATDYDR
ncbi:MAG: Trm112 family protein [Dehalococcoidales bacterium]|nr:Trm112 family protein [Dehalococcoidales bacterium]